MAATSTSRQEPTQVEAPEVERAMEQFVVWPHTSSSRLGRLAILAATFVVFGGVAMRAAIAGAWPQTIYLLIAVGGLALALCCNTRRARFAQVIEFTPDRIVVREQGPARKQRILAAFDPSWVRVEEARGQWDEKRLVMCQRGQSITIGDFLSVEERTKLAAELRQRIAERYALAQ